MERRGRLVQNVVKCLVSNYITELIYLFSFHMDKNDNIIDLEKTMITIEKKYYVGIPYQLS